MHEILISVYRKIAVNADPKNQIVVCDNTDYEAVFTFDSEWNGASTKTARFTYNGQYRDVVFNGNRCTIPKMSGKLALFTVGVYAGNLQTTTAATVLVRPSVLASGGVPDDPQTSVYNQIMAAMGGKQNTLTAGDGITIEDDVISATGGGGSSYDDTEVRQLIAGKANAVHTHSYNSLTDKPSIPEAYDDTEVKGMIAGKAAANHTHSYNSLTDKPTIPEAYDDTAVRGLIDALDEGKADADHVHVWDEIAEKPTIPAAYDDTELRGQVSQLNEDLATKANSSALNGKADANHTHSYNSLTDKPTIPSAYDDTALDSRVTALENGGVGSSIVENTHEFEFGSNSYIDKSTWTKMSGYYIDDYNNKFSASGGAYTVIMPCDHSTEYIVEKTSDARFRVSSSVDIPTRDYVTEQVIKSETASRIVITTTEESNYLLVYYYSSACSNSENDLYASLNVYKESTGYTIKQTAIDRVARNGNNTIVSNENELPASAEAYDKLWNDNIVNVNFGSHVKVIRETLATVHDKPVYEYFIGFGTRQMQGGGYTVVDTVGTTIPVGSYSAYYNKRKVLLISGVHGTERYQPVALYQWVLKLLSDPSMAKYRCFDYYIVPLVNPTGFDLKRDANEDGININRDAVNKASVEGAAICDLIDSQNYALFVDFHQSDYNQIVYGYAKQAHSTSDTIKDTVNEYLTIAGHKSDEAVNAYYSIADRPQGVMVWQDNNDASQLLNYAISKAKVSVLMESEIKARYYSNNSTTNFNDVANLLCCTFTEKMAEGLLDCIIEHRF